MENDEHYLKLGEQIGKRKFNPEWFITGFMIGFIVALMLANLIYPK